MVAEKRLGAGSRNEAPVGEDIFEGDERGYRAMLLWRAGQGRQLLVPAAILAGNFATSQDDALRVGDVRWPRKLGQPGTRLSLRGDRDGTDPSERVL